MEPIWRLIWSGGDEVGATGGLVDQQLEDDDGHYVDLQWSEATNSQIILLNIVYCKQSAGSSKIKKC